MDKLQQHLIEKADRVKKASRELASLNTEVKNRSLEYIAEELEKNRDRIKS